MKVWINKVGFIKAVEHVSSTYFSMPYTITPIVDRWFDQLAMLDFEGKANPVHLSGKVARQHVNIVLDGRVVDQTEIELVMQFYLKKSTHEKDLEKLVYKLAVQNALYLEQKELGAGKRVIEQIEMSIDAIEDEISAHHAKKIKAPVIYNDIVARGIPVLNVKQIEQTYGARLKNIVYKPNHGLTHSARAAYLVTALHAYYQNNSSTFRPLSEPHLDKLQLMMLFSVVGRCDETGFNDGQASMAVYAGFRAESGRAYVKYCKENNVQLYDNDLESLYRDAIIIELMGYDTLDAVYEAGKIPELFIDYVIEKEKLLGHLISREDALKLILDTTNTTYQMRTLFSMGVESQLANAKLDMMNDAHCFDLIRCYSLFPLRDGGAKYVNNMGSYLVKTQFFNFSDAPDPNKLTAIFDLMRCGFDMLELMGQRTTFGLLSREDFAARKDSILSEIKEISDRFQNPESRADLLELASQDLSAEDHVSYFESYGASNDDVLYSYRIYLINRHIAEKFAEGTQLKPKRSLFNFNHVVDDNFKTVDHHKNAISLVHALQTVTPISGVTSETRPIITSVEHLRKDNVVEVFFDTPEQANYFKDRYITIYDITPLQTSECSIQIDRANYKQLVNDQLIEFKPVTIPTVVEREDTLVDIDGDIDVLRLIKDSRGLGRLVSTSALSGENHPDYEYLFDALEDPIHQRYTATPKQMSNWPVDRTLYHDPRNGTTYVRVVDSSTVTDLRFQEPVVKPGRFEDKLQDGLVVRSERMTAKNTIYAKKSAHSLLPPHGMVIPFEGYRQKMSNYFPIGVLSDINEVDIKDGRYVWSSNMSSLSKFWVRDSAAVNKNIYKQLNAMLDGTDGLVQIDNTKVHQAENAEQLARYVEKKALSIIALLEHKQYQPSNDLLIQFIKLAKLQKEAFLAQFPEDKPQQQRIEDAYARIQSQLGIELARTSSKYAITIPDLIKAQQQTTTAGGHNEILAANTKGATRALYASKDALFDRLNLAFHAMKIKKKYGYDVPLLVMSQDKPPYHYTEDMIRDDLLNAYDLLQKGKFPYDRSLYPLYQLDDQGQIRMENGVPVLMKTSDGREMKVPKNMDYQQGVLLDLFKIGVPELTSINQLVRGKVGKTNIVLDDVVDEILEQMDVLGGLSREAWLMKQSLDKDKFFLRAAALGHLTLIELMMDEHDYTITPLLLDQAIQFAKKNHHLTVVGSLNKIKKEISALTDSVASLNKPISADDPFDVKVARIKLLIDVSKRYELLSKKIALPEINESIHNASRQLFLNGASQTSANEAQLSNFLKWLSENERYIECYPHVVDSHQIIELELMMSSESQLGIAGMIHVMQLCTIDDEDVLADYVTLASRGELDIAKKYFDYAIAHPDEARAANTIKKECTDLMIDIFKLSNDLKNPTAFGLSEKNRRLMSETVNNKDLLDVKSELITHKEQLMILRADIDQQKEAIEACLDDLEHSAQAGKNDDIAVLINDISDRYQALNKIVELPDLYKRIQEKIATYDNIDEEDNVARFNRLKQANKEIVSDVQDNPDYKITRQ